MEKRLIVAIIISTVILFGYQWVLTTYLQPPVPMSAINADTATPILAPLPAGRASADPPEADRHGGPAGIVSAPVTPETQRLTAMIPVMLPEEPVEEIITRKNSDLLEIEFSNRGGRIKQIVLKKYSTIEGEPVKLVGRLGEPADVSGLFRLAEDPAYPGQLTSAGYHVREENNRVVYEYVTRRDAGASTLPENLLVRKTYELDPTRYFITTGLEIVNQNNYEVAVKQGTLKNSDGMLQGSLFLQLGRGLGPNRSGYVEQSLYQENFVYRIDGKLKRTDPDSNEPKESQVLAAGAVDLLGLENRYFLVAMFPKPVGQGLLALTDNKFGKDGYVLLPEFTLKPGEAFTYTGWIYAGEKKTESLQAVDKSLTPLDGLEPWVLPVSIARGMVVLLRHIHGLIPNYGIAIILLTILVRIVLYPLTHHSIKSMKRMQEMQPKMAELKAKYGDRKDEFNKAVMKLYKEGGVNPMGGCLPMILQIPIFVGLFVALRASVELRGAGFCLWITDLSLPDTVYLLPFEIPLISNFMGRNLNILPVLYAITMFLSSKIGMPAAVTEEQRQQQAMMKFMPLVITVLMWNFPSGLYLYFTVSNILQIIQQKLTAARPTPRPTQ